MINVAHLDMTERIVTGFSRGRINPEEECKGGGASGRDISALAGDGARETCSGTVC
jgi:hypothetical protein